ncbi:MAG TPA: AraC family transcriptional regulator [Solimonas sp.]|nr:AraC family transcriptional regulator [Solimonas sp.]
MPKVDRSKPTVPVIYPQIIIQMAAEGGIDQRKLLEGTGIPHSLIRRLGSRISIDQHMALVRRAIALSGGKGELGYALGLRIALSAHGIVGFAAISQLTIRSAIEFAIRFSRVLVPAFRARLFVEDDTAVVDISSDMPIPTDLHRYAYDMLLVCIWRASAPMLGPGWEAIELWFDYPEPEYYAKYRERLPRCRFDMGANQICFPASYLTRRMATGDKITAEALEAQCRRELDLLGDDEDLLGRVRALLVSEQGYPHLDAVCERLFMSSRTLKRRLQQQDTSFQQLLDEAKSAEAMRLLKGTTLSIDKIAVRLGYSEPANFTTAFRKWTGLPPHAWRQQQAGK